MEQRGSATGRHRAPLSVAEKLTTVLIGVTSGLVTLAAGIATNGLSEHDALPRAAAVFAAAAVVAAAAWLRRLPRRAPLARHGTTVLLAGALACVVVSILVPRFWTALSIAAATVLTIAAVLTTTTLVTAAGLLYWVMAIGTGVAVMGEGIADLRSVDALSGVVVIGFGVMLIGSWFASWRLTVTRSVAPIGVKPPAVRTRHTPLGVSSIGFGVALIFLIGLSVFDVRDADPGTGDPLLGVVTVIGCGGGDDRLRGQRPV